MGSDLAKVWRPNVHLIFRRLSVIQCRGYFGLQHRATARIAATECKAMLITLWLQKEQDSGFV
jgi:hypothetical protein